MSTTPPEQPGTGTGGTRPRAATGCEHHERRPHADPGNAEFLYVVLR